MINIKEKVMLNGLKQQIHIYGKNDDKPILLYLHGGPGCPNRHAAMTNEKEGLDEDFIIVAWDQRGSGGSYFGCDHKKLTIDLMVSDASELVNYLCKKFNREKIFVMGESWGTILGTWLLYKHPEHLYCFLGFGQCVNLDENERISYNFCLEEAKKANNLKDVKALLKLGEPVMGVYNGGFKGMMKQRNIMMKYGGYSKESKQQSYWDALVKPMLKSHEYTFKDIIGYVFGYSKVLKQMLNELGTTNFNKTCTKFKAPIYIFDGKLDYNTPSELVESWFNKIEAPDKKLIWFEHSGHHPIGDEPEKFKKELKKLFKNLLKNGLDI